jgi:chromodomain-helicase-DNA-binding protein 4
LLSAWDSTFTRSQQVVRTDTDHDIEKLIEKTEKEGDQEQPEKKEGLSFSFAKIWAADKDTLEELNDDTTQSNDQDDSWAQTLAVSVGEHCRIRSFVER